MLSYATGKHSIHKRNLRHVNIPQISGNVQFRGLIREICMDMARKIYLVVVGARIFSKMKV